MCEQDHRNALNPFFNVEEKTITFDGKKTMTFDGKCEQTLNMNRIVEKNKNYNYSVVMGMNNL